MTAGRRIARIAAWVLLVPVALLVLLNLFLNLGLEPLVNRRPERVRLQYAWAWMVWPGDVHVGGLVVRGQGLRNQWLLEVGEASVTVDLPALFDRHFHARDVRARGASFRFRFRVDAEAPRDLGYTERGLFAGAFTPPIEGFTNPPDPNPDTLYPPPPPPEEAWLFELEDLQVEGLREVWVEDYRVAADASASGTLRLRPRDFVSVEGGVVELVGAEVYIGAEQILRRVAGRVELGVDRLNPNPGQGITVLSALSGKVDLAAEVTNLAFVDYYLAEVPFLELRGGEGDLDLDLVLEQGSLARRSRARIAARRIEVVYLGYSFKGSGEVELEVPAAGAERTELDFRLATYELTRDGSPSPSAVGTGLMVRVESPSTRFYEPFDRAEVRLDLGDAFVPDVRVFNDYLPRGIGLAFTGGSARLTGGLKVDTPANAGEGSLALSGNQLRLVWDGMDLRGDLAVRARLPSIDLDRRRFDLAGSLAELSRVQLRGGSSAQPITGWWAKVRVAEGGVAGGEPVFLDTTVTAQLKDAAPLVDVFTTRAELPKWVNKVVKVVDVEGRARIRAGDGLLHLPDVAVETPKIGLLLQLKKVPEALDGLMFIELSGIPLAVRLGTPPHVQVLKPRKWYDEQPPIP